MCPHAYSTESTALSQQIKHSSPVIAQHDGVLGDSEDSELNVVPGDHSNHKENSNEKYIFGLEIWYISKKNLVNQLSNRK